MNRLARRRNIAAAAWVIVAAVVWNGVYDLLLMRSVEEHLRRAAMHEAGRGPFIPLAEAMPYAIYDAIWKSTLAASLILLAGVTTIRYIGQEGR